MTEKPDKQLDRSISQAIGRMINRIVDVYIGEDKEPQRIMFLHRFASSAFGCAVFFLSLGGTLFVNRIDSRIRTEVSLAIKNVIEQPNQPVTFRDEIRISWEDIFSIRDIETLALVLYFAAITLILPILIASSIKFGGPLRFFFLGVVVPSFIYTVLRSTGVFSSLASPVT